MHKVVQKSTKNPPKIDFFDFFEKVIFYCICSKRENGRKKSKMGQFLTKTPLCQKVDKISSGNLFSI
jgi:hypothetical protein